MGLLSTDTYPIIVLDEFSTTGTDLELDRSV